MHGRPFEQALNGDMDALFALAALSRLAEAEKRPPLFGAPAAFWEDWAVRMLGGKEAWFRIGAALFECGKTDGLPQVMLWRMATDTLRKAAKLEHPEAMFALAFLSRPYPDTSFQMPKDPGFPIYLHEPVIQPDSCISIMKPRSITIKRALKCSPEVCVLGLYLPQRLWKQFALPMM